ncbi:MAG: DNA cytosine methyltransferase [Croceibacterium sp.]
MKKPTMVSLFTGCGGLDLGLEQAGFETVFANEIEPYACESLRANRILRALPPEKFDEWFDEQILRQRCYKGVLPVEHVRLRRRLLSAFKEGIYYLNNAYISERDIRSLSASDVLEKTGAKRGEIDLVAGGPPCQPFSRAGKRELVESDTGQLFLDFVRIIKGVQPRWFLFENVKGLVLHKADVASRKCAKCHYAEIVPFSDRDGLKAEVEVTILCHNCGIIGDHEVIWDKRRAGSLDIIRSEFERCGYKCSARILDAC